MEDLSEQAIRANCPHCDLASQTFNYLLEQTDNFSIVCDVHPIIEGHILIIPKQHISCIGEYPKELYEEFINLNDKVSDFLLKEYGSVSSFEHGIFGQTVFHSHIHYLPFRGNTKDIVPEEEKIFKINDLSELQKLFKRDGGYLFFSIDKNKWSVDTNIVAPRFFRDRYAKVLGRPERGNWKSMRTEKSLMKQAVEENIRAQRKWRKYFA